MITVKFFGLLRIDYDVRQVLVNAGKVSQVLNEIEQSCPQIPRERLLQAVMMINGEPANGNKRFSATLKEGDELALLGPASGG